MRVQTGAGVVELVDLPLACCALESSAMALSLAESALDEPKAAVLCISGTISQKSAASVRASWEQLREQFQTVRVIAVGACASSGGPYWDSPAIIPGADQLIPVDLMVPGCPPRPDQIHAAIEQVMR